MQNELRRLKELGQRAGEDLTGAELKNVRTSITLTPLILACALERMRAKGFRKLSEYVADLVRGEMNAAARRYEQEGSGECHVCRRRAARAKRKKK